jgi:hypothetical protein
MRANIGHVFVVVVICIVVLIPVITAAAGLPVIYASFHIVVVIIIIIVVVVVRHGYSGWRRLRRMPWGEVENHPGRTTGMRAWVSTRSAPAIVPGGMNLCGCGYAVVPVVSAHI